MQDNLRDVGTPGARAAPSRAGLAVVTSGSGRLAGPERIVERARACSLPTGASRAACWSPRWNLQADRPGPLRRQPFVGKMGHAIDRRARRRAQVARHDRPAGARGDRRVGVETGRPDADRGARDRRGLRRDRWRAVADFRPKAVAPEVEEGRRRTRDLLEPTVDILAELAPQAAGSARRGSAAETERASGSAAAKLAAKRVDPHCRQRRERRRLRVRGRYHGRSSSARGVEAAAATKDAPPTGSSSASSQRA